jgi:excisionase family DNA binding protein
MPPARYNRISPESLPALRFEIAEAAHILRMSRAQLYNRIHEGTLRAQKDGARTYITRVELERYVVRCETAPDPHPASDFENTRGHRSESARSPQ